MGYQKQELLCGHRPLHSTCSFVAEMLPLLAGTYHRLCPFHIILRSRIYPRSSRQATPPRSTTAPTPPGAVTSQSNGRCASERRQPMGRAGSAAANQRAGGAGFERGGRDGCRPAAVCPLSVSCLRKYKPNASDGQSCPVAARASCRKRRLCLLQS